MRPVDKPAGNGEKHRRSAAVLESIVRRDQTFTLARSLINRDSTWTDVRVMRVPGSAESFNRTPVECPAKLFGGKRPDEPNTGFPTSVLNAVRRPSFSPRITYESLGISGTINTFNARRKFFEKFVRSRTFF